MNILFARSDAAASIPVGAVSGGYRSRVAAMGERHLLGYGRGHRRTTWCVLVTTNWEAMNTNRNNKQTNKQTRL